MGYKKANVVRLVKTIVISSTLKRNFWELVDMLQNKILHREAIVGVIGLGYVGLPLVLATHNEDFSVLGFDIDPHKVYLLNVGKNYIYHIDEACIQELSKSDRFRAITDFSYIKQCDVILICVPTPLTKHREPDMTYVIETTKAIQPHLRAGQLIILESTTYPGTSKELIQPILEKGGYKSQKDFFLAYSPEREDPGNPTYKTTSIPKVVGGDGEKALKLACTFYEQLTVQTVPVSSLSTAEAVKLTENIFRCINIALVNELKVVFDAMNIDIWEVIEAAKTKPFGFMPFYPGPGPGGHCIPIDPFYLTWKARGYGLSTKFIELAGEINTSMTDYVIQKLSLALDIHFQKGFNKTKILIVGIAYKKNVDDIRGSPAFVLMERLQKRGANVHYYDPYVPEILPMREHKELIGMKSILFPNELSSFDSALICTDHVQVDYTTLVEKVPLIIDTRNATKNILEPALRKKIIKA